jgi:hypothetical protein
VKDQLLIANVAFLHLASVRKGLGDDANTSTRHMRDRSIVGTCLATGTVEARNRYSVAIQDVVEAGNVSLRLLLSNSEIFALLHHCSTVACVPAGTHGTVTILKAYLHGIHNKSIRIGYQ